MPDRGRRDPASVDLHGYRYSVYLRIAAMTLAEKNVSWTHVEVDPFAETIPEAYLALNPFGRVPTLVHGGFVLYETAAITRYVDEAFGGAALQPEDPKQRARMNQITAVADSYGYWPMVRQVFSQRVFNPARGRAGDEVAVGEGLKKSCSVLAALEGLATGGQFLVGASLTLADLHLGAMVAYFAAAEEGRLVIARHPKLSEWWAAFSKRQTLLVTDPGLPSA